MGARRDWTIESGTSSLNAPDGRIAFRFHARDVHLVLGSREETRVPFRVLLDGALPGAAHGLDVDEDGEGTLVQPRVHIRLVVVVDEPSLLSQASDRGLADQAPRLLYGRDCFVLCGVAFAGSRRWGAVGVDELPVVAAVGLHHHLEVGDSSRFLVALRLRSVVHHAA